MAAASPCIVPFAIPLPEAGRQAWQGLCADAQALPNLQALLRKPGVAERAEPAPETLLSTPAERAWARAVGWRGPDGTLPFAAQAARADGVDVGERAWGLITPVHWHVGTEQVGLTDPQALMLDAAESRALFDAVKALFVDEGFVFVWGAPLRWYLAHESLAGLASASLDRVIGRNVDAWLGAAREQPALRRMHRLQAEMQMLLYSHPMTDARAARGLPPVNSFWLSGCGVAQAVSGPEPTLLEGLRRDAMAGDWAAWAKAWEALDAGPLAALAAQARAGAPVELVLCGERGWLRIATPASGPGWWARLRRRFAAPDLAALTAEL